MIFLGLSIGAVLLFLGYHLQRYQYTYRILPPGPFTFPIFGNFLQFVLNCRKAPWIAIDSLSKRYGDVYSLTIGRYYGIVLCSYEAMEEVLDRVEWSGKITNEFTRSRSFGKELGLVFVSDPDIWLEMRKFSQRTLRDFGFGKSLSMQAMIEAELVEVVEEVKQSIQATNGVLRIKINFLLSILNVTWGMIAGVRYAHNDPRLIKMMENNFAATKIQTLADPIYLLFPWIRKWFPGLTGENFRQKLVNEMHGFAKSLVDERKEEGNYLNTPLSFIDVFLNEIQETSSDPTSIYTEEQLLLMIEDFFQIGSTTTSATLSWAILYMVLYPDIQTKIQAEISELVPNHLVPTMDDIKKMPFTQATILEIHRHSCVVPNPAPRVLSEETIYRNWKIPKGTCILSNHYSVMMDKRYWGDPENFRPDRFLSSDGKFIPDKHVVHFGFGKRYCIAATLVNSMIPIYLTGFLQKFSFSQVPGKLAPSCKPEVGLSLSPYPFDTLVEIRN